MKPTKLKIGQRYRIIFPAYIKKWMLKNNRNYSRLEYAIDLEMLNYDNEIVVLSSQYSPRWFNINNGGYIWPASFFHNVVDILPFYASLKALIENESRRT